MRHIIIVKCSSCGQKLFKYYKRCPGKLWHLWYNNIIENHTEANGENIYCPKCGNLVGIAKKKYIKLIKGRFTY